MRMVTLKLKPKNIFGLIMLATGILVAVVSFVGNHNVTPTSVEPSIKCESEGLRKAYITSLGYTVSGKETSKEIIIPNVFNNVYNEYNEIQQQQGFDLRKYKGKKATLYTYNISNYKDNENVVADLIVCEGKLIGADLCDTSADNGFLVALNEQT